MKLSRLFFFLIFHVLANVNRLNRVEPIIVQLIFFCGGPNILVRPQHLGPMWPTKMWLEIRLGFRGYLSSVLNLFWLKLKPGFGGLTGPNVLTYIIYMLDRSDFSNTIECVSLPLGTLNSRKVYDPVVKENLVDMLVLCPGFSFLDKNLIIVFT